MPFIEPVPAAGKKRKRSSEEKPSVSRQPVTSERIEEIRRLEDEISQSRKHFNNIARLLALATSKKTTLEIAELATLSLCRAFCRLYVEGEFQPSGRQSQSEKALQKWLLERLRQYIQFLLEQITGKAVVDRVLTLNCILRLVKQEVDSDGPRAWIEGLFSETLSLLFTGEGDDDATLDEFVKKYFLKYGDVRYYTLSLLPQVTDGESPCIPHLLNLLFSLGTPLSDDDDIAPYLCTGSARLKKTVGSIKAHKKRAQDAWLSVLGQNLNEEQRHQILRSMVHEIVPWFNKIERLLDFLTDCYNAGSESSLLALSGLFYLIQEKNLDYPSFYQKLYSLLTPELLHSKHRSRFFRLLDTFMASTHLPAALVASFIKRLSRLALHAPPASIVLIIPWIYNMFRRHPLCTFMMHREPRSARQRDEWETLGVQDPFDMAEQDPMETTAIGSDVWELVTLQSHYHPNVATLAKIISEQFTKQSYNLEDFLDHSYDSLLATELDKDPKRSAVVEYDIPRTILTDEDEPFSKMLEDVFGD